MSKKIAIIGGGLAGVGAAWVLASKNEVTLYEKNDYLGGHARTVDVTTPAGTFPVDMGVILTSPWSYQNLYATMEQLGVGSQSVGWSLGASFGPGGADKWWTGGEGSRTPLFESLREQASRFTLETYKLSNLPGPQQAFMTVGQVLSQGGYTDEFAAKMLGPMLTLLVVTRAGLLDTTMVNVIGLFKDRQLSFFDATEWRTLAGGTRSLIQAMEGSFPGAVQLSSTVEAVTRGPSGVTLKVNGVDHEHDEVIFTTNAEVILSLLTDASPQEQGIFSQYQYQPAEVYLHSDVSVLSPALDKDLYSQYYDPNPSPAPNNLEGSFSLNVGRGFMLPKNAGPVYVTGYNVSSTMKRPQAGKIFARSDWRHTISTPQMVGARASVHTVQGVNRTWYCGESITFSAAEAALASGYAIGQKLGASYPFNPTTHPRARESYVEIWKIMFPGTSPP